MPVLTRTAVVERSSDPSVAEYVCLSLIEQGISHGWAVGTMLGAEGEIGRIWTLSRPLTYRAIDQLVEKKLVLRKGGTPSHGRERVLLTPTAKGRRVATQWLDAPVQHLRDVRTELLLKLALRNRAGLGNEGLLAAQQEVFEPAIDTLTSTQGVDDLTVLWRRESARAVRRFLEQALRRMEIPRAAGVDLRLSARNQMQGTIAAIHHGEIMATVKAVLKDGQALTAAITRDAVDELDLVPGDDVVMIVKSTEVMVAKK